MQPMVEPITNIMNGDSINSTSHNNIVIEKRVHQVSMPKADLRQMLDVKSTVIVNNSKVEPPIAHNEENSTANNSKKFDLKIEHYFSSSKEEFKSVAEKDMPYVNIKSSIELKQNGNDEEKNENTLNVNAPITSMAAKPEMPMAEEVVLVKETKEEPPVIEKVSDVKEVPQIIAPPENKSWASVAKSIKVGQNSSESHVELISKPTAVIVPNVIANVNHEKHEKSEEKPVHSAPKCHQNKSSSENAPNKQKKPLHTEMPQRYCDDPFTYRMGSK